MESAKNLLLNSPMTFEFFDLHKGHVWASSSLLNNVNKDIVNVPSHLFGTADAEKCFFGKQ
jgi:hypothetical protein